MNSTDQGIPSWSEQPSKARTPQGSGPYTGPDTSSQLVALQELERLSVGQNPGSPAHRVRPPESAPRRPVQPASAAPAAAATISEGQRTGRHHAAQSRGDKLLQRHGARFASFSVIGGGVFIAGLLIQAVLTGGLHVPSFVSYIFQAVVSVEASYFLNRWFTWKGVRVSLWASFLRYNLQKVVTVTANLVLYGILLKLGLEYLLANILLTIAFTFVNYIGADRLVFLQGSKHLVAALTGPLPSLGVTGELKLRRQPVRRELPSVSVVIPVRANEKTIKAAIDSILGQDYPMLRELILVGSPGDSTWTALREVNDPRLFIMETETPPGIRDANFKRDLGIRETVGDLVSLIDSDMVIPPDWMSSAVRLLMENEVDCVAGVMRSIRDDFWGRFVDGNRLGAKTPRAKAAYLVTAEGFGAAGYKPPITADILFTRRMYEDCPIDSTWSHGSLEDYEWFWRVVESGHKVLVSNDLFGWHHHRAGFKKLAAEYRRSARGCAYFIRAHRESPFAQKRMTQAIVLPLSALMVLLGVVAAAAMDDGPLAAAGLLTAAVAGVLLLCGREFARTRTLESLVYPIPAAILGINYTASLAAHLVRNSPINAVSPSTHRYPDIPVDAPMSRQGLARLLHPLTFILGVETVFSLSLVWSNTAFPDEADYLWVGRTLIGHALHGTSWPTGYAHNSISGLPYFYPLLGAIANEIGGLAGARILSLTFILISTALVYSATFGLFDRLTAVGAAALWSVFSPSVQLGAFATFDAMSVMLTALAAWLVVRTGTSHRRGELVAVSGAVLALAELAAYSGIVMIPVVVAFAFIAWFPAMGTRQAAFCAAWLAAVCILVFSGIMTIFKTWAGLFTTILSRHITTGANSSALHVFDDSWTYSGLIAILAVIGVIVTIGEGRRARTIQMAFLASLSLVIPIAQANEGTAVSLKKHLAYGAIFACMAAAYCLAKVVRSLSMPRIVIAACCVVGIVYPAVNGYQQSRSWYESWPNEGPLLAKLDPLLASTSNVSVSLTDGNYICPYHFASGDAWQNCATGTTISAVEQAKPNVIVLGYPASVPPPSTLPSGLLLSPNVSQSALLSAINEAGGIRTSTNVELPQLTKILETSGKYRLVATGPYNSNQSDGIYTIWQKVGS